jgi:hypothetical protein
MILLVAWEEDKSQARDSGLVSTLELAELIAIPDIARDPSSSLESVSEELLKKHLRIALVGFLPCAKGYFAFY